MSLDEREGFLEEEGFAIEKVNAIRIEPFGTKIRIAVADEKGKRGMFVSMTPELAAEAMTWLDAAITRARGQAIANIVAKHCHIDTPPSP